MLVSVIIPVYNAESYIARCVTSVLDQSYANLEVILVDDCSTDSTLSVLRGVLDERNDSRVRLICHECNQGSAATRTTGIKAAHGDYMVHVDSDDWIDHDFVAKMVNKAIASNADIVVCEYCYEYTCHSERCHISESTDNNVFLARVLSGDLHASLWNKLIRSSIIFKYNLSPLPGANILDDKSMLYKVAYYANSIAYVNEPLYHYNRCNAASYTSDSQNLHETVLKNAESYLHILADMSQFFSVRSVPPFVLRALVQFRIFILSMILVNGSIAIVKSRKELFCGIGWKDVLASSVAVHYKMAVMLYLCKMWPAIGLLSSAIRHIKKIRSI